MAHTKKSWQDYLTDSFGMHGEVKPGTNALEIGAAAQEGGAFERLPIGTSTDGTAVKVDLIASEAVSVTVGTVGIHGFTGTAGTSTLGRLTHTAGKLDVLGTVTGVGVLADGTVGEVGTVTGMGVLALGTVKLTEGSVDATLLGGTVANLDAGTITRVQGGTIGNLDGGSVVVTVGTITAGTVVEGLHDDTFGSSGTLGGTATGTIVGSVSGSALYVTDLMISSEGAATVIIGDGTPTVPLAEVFFAGAGNAPMPGMKTPIQSSGGSDVVYSTGGGTVAVVATGYID
jgi:hypothetical protein